jgi:phosphatidylinositol 4-kinase B
LPKYLAAALKRFTIESGGGEIPTTPKEDVEEMVSIAVVQQLQEIVMPNLDFALKEEEKDGESVSLKDTETIGGGPVVEVKLDMIDGDGLSSPPRAGPEAGRTGQDSSPSTSLGDVSISKKMSALGNLTCIQSDPGETKNTLAPTGDVRREVLNTIMMQGLQGNSIAAGAAISLQRSLQELERKRATELMLSGDDLMIKDKDSWTSEADAESSRERLVALGISLMNEEAPTPHTEEDEVMEAIRLLLIQNRVAQGHLSPADAAKVLQHASLNKVVSKMDAFQNCGGLDGRDRIEELATVDAGDVDRRLVGCGPAPPAVLQALTLWKGGMVTNAELLELVKKDAAFVRHSVLIDAENIDKLNEDSAFWGRFAFGERWAEKKSRIASSSPQGALPGWDLVGVIVKANDDLRQEAFIMQLIKLCQEAFELAGLELWVNPYRILATGRTSGVIEMVRNAMSFDALKKRPGYGKGGLREHLLRMTEFTADPGEAFKSAQLNFVRSVASYSLMSYFFSFKDRHNGNILLDTAGHVIHIDFGFVFGQAPGGSFSLEMSTPFKLTEEMLDVMGGLRSPLFSEFVTLFCCGFLALQSYSDTFLTIVEITCENSTFKCFDGRETTDIVSKLRERFCPDLGKEDTVSFALDLIKQATTSYGTRQYDLFQYMSQGIAA